MNFQYVHGVDHQVPYTSLEGHIDSVGGLLHFCRNTTEENSVQVHGLVVGQCGLPLGLLVHLNSKRPETDKSPILGSERVVQLCWRHNKQAHNLPGSLSIRSECSRPSFRTPWSGRLTTRRGLWLPVNIRTSRPPLFSITERKGFRKRGKR